MKIRDTFLSPEYFWVIKIWVQLFLSDRYRRRSKETRRWLGLFAHSLPGRSCVERWFTIEWSKSVFDNQNTMLYSGSIGLGVDETVCILDMLSWPRLTWHATRDMCWTIQCYSVFWLQPSQYRSREWQADTSHRPLRSYPETCKTELSNGIQRKQESFRVTVGLYKLEVTLLFDWIE